MFDDDIDDFFEDDEFATQAVVLDTQRIISGIFDRPFSDALDIQGFSPMLTVPSKVATENLTKGYRLDIDREIFHVVQLEPDGTGITRVILECE